MHSASANKHSERRISSQKLQFMFFVIFFAWSRRLLAPDPKGHAEVKNITQNNFTNTFIANNREVFLSLKIDQMKTIYIGLKGSAKTHLGFVKSFFKYL